MSGWLNCVKRLALAAAALATLVTAAGVGLLNAPSIRAQDVTDWQAKAGGKMAFDVASVKPSKGPSVPSSVSLDPWDDYSAANGRFTADATLSTYIAFAYKLWPNDLQRREFSRPPKWVASDRYRIEATAASGNATRDQMRLMLQSLLAGRFQLAAHLEAREVPVFELRLAHPGKPGPKLISHAAGPPCDQPGTSPGEGLPGFPTDCHSLWRIDKPGGVLLMIGSRDVTMDALAAALSISGLGRPVVDKSGLQGKIDFTLEWAREPRGVAASDAPPAAPAGPTPIEALRDQLGLKLEPAKASLPILVIDKVERPSEN